MKFRQRRKRENFPSMEYHQQKQISQKRSANKRRYLTWRFRVHPVPVAKGSWYNQYDQYRSLVVIYWTCTCNRHSELSLIYTCLFGGFGGYRPV
ncbi:hypothetical protein GDO86_014765 [Hymenochirus boettgeri]|uniref:Uncharacterized protein n=1 Tax=Hymenochirus boettgeri TaxID=247094 RepID=A0A8T2JVJ5_9PIPI|nr:hypothetical protein GDO86_014765 [Hymenochirus boettgeri]